MAELLALDPDELLSTTRAVRKRLDLERPVELEVVREALAVAMQAPSGGNRQQWHWIVLTEPEVRAQVAAYYKRSYDAYSGKRPATTPAQQRMASSSDYLSEILEQVPVLVIGAITVGDSGLPAGNQAGLWGSLLPAAWSLQLALRARGLGSAWTTLHLAYESEVAALLGLPDNIARACCCPLPTARAPSSSPGRVPISTRWSTSTVGETRERAADRGVRFCATRRPRGLGAWRISAGEPAAALDDHRCHGPWLRRAACGPLPTVNHDVRRGAGGQRVSPEPSVRRIGVASPRTRTAWRRTLPVIVVVRVAVPVQGPAVEQASGRVLPGSPTSALWDEQKDRVHGRVRTGTGTTPPPELTPPHRHRKQTVPREPRRRSARRAPSGVQVECHLAGGARRDGARGGGVHREVDRRRRAVGRSSGAGVLEIVTTWSRQMVLRRPCD